MANFLSSNCIKPDILLVNGSISLFLCEIYSGRNFFDDIFECVVSLIYQFRSLRNDDDTINQVCGFVFPNLGTKQTVSMVKVEWGDLVFTAKYTYLNLTNVTGCINDELGKQCCFADLAKREIKGSFKERAPKIAELLILCLLIKCIVTFTLVFPKISNLWKQYILESPFRISEVLNSECALIMFFVFLIYIHSVKLLKILMSKEVGEYKDRSYPILSLCDLGTGIGNLKKPCGVTTENISDNIYVCDSLNDRVQVFSSEGVPLFVFGHNPLESVRMNNPHSIVIFNHCVTVSQDGKSNGSTACMLMFTIDGDLITAWSLQGKVRGEFRCAYGLAIDETCEELYVCDYCQNKVLIFSNYSPKLDEIAGLFLPISVHLTDNRIVILNNSDPCVYEYSYELQLLKSYIARDWRQVSIPTCLALDSHNNIIITDRGAHCIHIFRRDGTLVRVIFNDIQLPSAITIDRKGRIILTSIRNEHCLQIF